MNDIRVVELFAGVGGFRLGLEQASKRFKTVWSSQWEPGVKTQHASEIYRKHWGDTGHSNEDIQEVIKNKFDEIPEHDLLVGGFPCQDYSVARTLSQSKGIEGKKGVLWWSIFNILKLQGKKAPKYIFLENVDRLLKSPASQRGRDFAIMLSSLASLGYAVEWRVINAADYGMPQRRRRVFILGYKKGTTTYNQISKAKIKLEWLTQESTNVQAFPITDNITNIDTFELDKDLYEVSSKFSSHNPKTTPFQTTGVMIDGSVTTAKVAPKYNGPRKVLRDVVITDESTISPEYFIDELKDKTKWVKLKGSKSEERTTKTGHTYHYSEGGMAFPDDLDKPSRTIVTGEGGSGPSRFKHVIPTASGRLRRLVPEELEQLNMFPSGHTRYMLEEKQTPSVRRAFIMGNALVVGVIEKFGKELIKLTRKPKVN